MPVVLEPALSSGIETVYRAANGFAAVDTNGMLRGAWGDPGIVAPDELLAELDGQALDKVVGCYYTFVVLTSAGRALSWGNADYGGNYTSVDADLASGVVDIACSFAAAMALKSDGSVVVWGLGPYGGRIPSHLSADLASGVTELHPGYTTVAARKGSTGQLLVWGWDDYGGLPGPSIAPLLTSGVAQVTMGTYAIAAVLANGTAVAWGYTGYGGDPSAEVRARLSSGIARVFGTLTPAYYGAFTALRVDGSIAACWGQSSGGGDCDELLDTELAGGVVDVFASAGAFAALKSDGSVVSWGNRGYGANFGSVVRGRRVLSIMATHTGFAATFDDGNVTYSATNTSQPTVRPTDAPTQLPSASPTTSPTEPDPWCDEYDGPFPGEVARFGCCLHSVCVPGVGNAPNFCAYGADTLRGFQFPTSEPTRHPTASPTHEPTTLPTMLPTANPTVALIEDDSGVPTTLPTENPTVHAPTANPTVAPTKNPVVEPPRVLSAVLSSSSSSSNSYASYTPVAPVAPAEGRMLLFDGNLTDHYAGPTQCLGAIRGTDNCTSDADCGPDFRLRCRGAIVDPVDANVTLCNSACVIESGLCPTSMPTRQPTSSPTRMPTDSPNLATDTPTAMPSTAQPTLPDGRTHSPTAHPITYQLTQAPTFENQTHPPTFREQIFLEVIVNPDHVRSVQQAGLSDLGKLDIFNAAITPNSAAEWEAKFVCPPSTPVCDWVSLSGEEPFVSGRRLDEGAVGGIIYPGDDPDKVVYEINPAGYDYEIERDPVTGDVIAFVGEVIIVSIIRNGEGEIINRVNSTVPFEYIPLPRCSAGTFSASGFVPSEEVSQCSPCPHDQYQTERGAVACSPCPPESPRTAEEGATSIDDCTTGTGVMTLGSSIVKCPVGADCRDAVGVTLETLPMAAGWWRGSTDTLNLLRCPWPSHCVGGASDLAELCRRNHTDTLCYSCVPGHARRGPWRHCLPCDQEALDADYLRALAVLLGGFFFVFTIVVVSLAAAVRRMRRDFTARVDGLKRKARGEASGSDGDDDDSVNNNNKNNNSPLGVDAAASRRPTVSKYALRWEAFRSQAALGTKATILISHAQMMSGTAILFRAYFAREFVTFSSAFSVVSLDLAAVVDAGCMWESRGGLTHHVVLLIATLYPVVSAIGLAVASQLLQRLVRRRPDWFRIEDAREVAARKEQRRKRKAKRDRERAERRRQREEAGLPPQGAVGEWFERMKERLPWARSQEQQQQQGAGDDDDKDASSVASELDETPIPSSPSVLARVAILNRQIRSIFSGLIIGLLFVAYPLTSGTVLEMFVCDEHEDGRRVLRADPSIDCDDAAHAAYIKYAIFATVTWVFGVVALIATLLWRRVYVVRDARVVGGMPTPRPSVDALRWQATDVP